MHPKHIQLHLRQLIGRIEVGHRAECRGAGVGAENRDIARGQLLGQLGAFGGVCEIYRAHLDGHSVALGEPLRQRGQDVLASGRDDQVMPSGGKLSGQRFADVLRGAGDDGTGIRAGCGYWHGADYIVGHHERSAAVGADRPAVAGAGVGALGLRLDRVQRDRRDVRVLGLPHQHRGRRPGGRHQPRELADAGPGSRRSRRRPSGAGHWDLGGRAGASTTDPGRADGTGGPVHVGDGPDPRRPPLPLAGPGVVGLRVGLQRAGHRALQRHAATALHSADIRPGIWIRLGDGLFRQCAAVADRLPRVHLRRR